MTRLRSYTVSFAPVEVVQIKDISIYYIIYYNILYNIKFNPQESAAI
jgi:hypothetical protein